MYIKDEVILDDLEDELTNEQTTKTVPNVSQVIHTD